MAVVYWLPCYWLEGEAEPAVAMEAEVQKGEEAAGCLGEEGEAASCPLEVAADLQGNQKSVVFFLLSSDATVHSAWSTSQGLVGLDADY